MRRLASAAMRARAQLRRSRRGALLFALGAMLLLQGAAPLAHARAIEHQAGVAAPHAHHAEPAFEAARPGSDHHAASCPECQRFARAQVASDSGAPSLPALPERALCAPASPTRAAERRLVSPAAPRAPPAASLRA